MKHPGAWAYMDLVAGMEHSGRGLVVAGMEHLELDLAAAGREHLEWDPGSMAVEGTVRRGCSKVVVVVHWAWPGMMVGVGRRAWLGLDSVEVLQDCQLRAVPLYPGLEGGGGGGGGGGGKG